MAASGPWLGEKAFELQVDAPPPWSWEEYENWLGHAWGELLSTADPLDEKPFQTMLQEHPCLLPGGDGGDQSFGGHHGGWRDLVITQPPLPGLFKRYPDFMWLSKNSEEIIPVLIEIEAPGKPWFNKNGQRSAKLTQAQDQLGEWKDALDKPATREQFADLYDFPDSWSRRHRLVPRYLLIYGRRAEFERRPEINTRRGVLRGPATDIMTFDRLRPLFGSAQALCVRLVGRSRRLVGVPPTLRLGPRIVDQLQTIDGWEDAIERSPLISPARKDFLLKRLPYWRERADFVAAGGSLGPTSGLDWE